MSKNPSFEEGSQVSPHFPRTLCSIQVALVSSQITLHTESSEQRQSFSPCVGIWKLFLELLSYICKWPSGMPQLSLFQDFRGRLEVLLLHLEEMCIGCRMDPLPMSYREMARDRSVLSLSPSVTPSLSPCVCCVCYLFSATSNHELVSSLGGTFDRVHTHVIVYPAAQPDYLVNTEATRS